MSTRPTIVLAGSLDKTTEARLDAAATVQRVPARDLAPLLEAVREADAIICRTHTPITAEVLSAGQRLRVVGVAGVGLDRVDLAAAEARGIAVLNRPGAATQAVAELTVLLMLLLERPVQHLSPAYEQGKFEALRMQPHGRELHEKTIGIVGMGRIGSRVAGILARGFGCRVLYNDIVAVGPFDFDCESVSKDELWTTADVISLHVPLTDQTRSVINAQTLAAMQADCHLINTCRGAVVDTDALAQALQAGRIGGAGLDVSDPEPLPTDHPLFQHERCILTPHIASRTCQGIGNMYAVADDVLAFLDRG
jgi:D-3-phosphoglycerate dehydrogenase